MRRFWGIIYFLAVLGGGVALMKAAEGRLRIVTTFLPAYCFTKNVAGELAEVENLLPGNVSPHDYQLSPREMKALSRADLVIMNGLGIEAWMGKALSGAGVSAQKIVVLSQGMEKELLPFQPDGGAGASQPFAAPLNPHIWLDPTLAMRGVSNVVKALQAADPKNAAAFQRNGDDYLARLRTLDQYIQEKTTVARQKPFITYHNAFAYFARRYQLEVAAMIEQTPDVAPTPRQVGELMKIIREKKVRAIFTEPQSSSRLAKQIASDAGIAIASLDTLETGPLNPAAYEEGMKRNADTLWKVLR